MRKYRVTVDYTMTADILVEAMNAESAANKAGRFVHTRKGFDAYIDAAAHRNVILDGRSECSGCDGFDIPKEPDELESWPDDTDGCIMLPSTAKGASR